jgi:predicted ATPase/signal transduction histidine kinase
MPALVLEDFGGQSLDALLGTPMEIESFLELAIRIAGAVADIHRKGVIHKDLKPHNIIVNPATGEVKIADFGLASRLPREQPPVQPTRLIEGSFPYLSPEQTGRTNRAVDDRADLYSLGVTLYQMLTGRLPFEARDPVEWVHCHVARAPVPPSEIVADVPETIARIILKLLEKTPEDRYQSARGLKVDLERCLEQWREHGRIEAFALGERDTTGRLQIPQRLYGRETEIALLLEAFGRVASEGTPELLLVSGYSGIGKTALVRELGRPVVRARGFFISGKFDQYKRDIPYATITQAFRQLVQEILAESEAKLATFRKHLLSALGGNGQLIIDVIPQVELILGKQPPVAELSPTEAQNRFRVVFRHFIEVFARKEHPLVIFLDDLQWADSASLALLSDLLTHPALRHLFIVGAYRDNEVSVSHPLLLSLHEARRAGARISNIVLGPLSREHLAAFIGDALHCRPEETKALAELLEEKTAGNPFFAIHFLTALHDEGLIELDGHAGAFRWDMARIRAKDFTDNVIDLMLEKLRRLPASTQEALRLFACLGSIAEVSLLSMIRGRPEADTEADLWEAMRAGLVLRLDGAYKFLHDRVQEAAYALIPEGERAAMHLRIGRLLASRTAPEEIEEKIFDIVNQLDRGASLITSREERERVAGLDLVAGERARRSTAHASALKYFAAGVALLGEEGWDRRYELAFALELHRAECEYLTGALSAAEERLSSLWRRAKNLVDLAAVACARINLYTTQDRSDLAVDAGLQYLKLVGVTWSRNPTEDEVAREYEEMWRRLGSRPIEELIDLPPLTDPRWRATMDVLAMLVSPAMYTDRKLICLVIGHMANLSLEHGNSDASCFGYVWLGMLLGAQFGNHQAGFRFGKLGLYLVDKRGLLRFKARVYLCFGSLVNPWTRHLGTGIDLVRRAFDTACETGDLTFASNICSNLITLLLAAGEPLAEVQREAENALAFVRKAQFGLIVDRITGQLQLIRMLRGLLPSFASLNDPQFDESRFEKRLEGDPRLAIAACFYWIRKLEARYFAGAHASAIDAASRAERHLWAAPSFFEVAEYHFHAALARAAHHDAAPAGERPGNLAALVAHHETIEGWAPHCPDNFKNRAALVAAEIARIRGDKEGAAELYEQAIRGARDGGFVQNEAIAHETAARFYRARGFDLIADAYLREAANGYLRWGADGKVQELERLHPQLAPQRPPGPAATLAMQTDQLDLVSVAKASQTISSEIVLDELLRTLLLVVLEQGGAQRACLLRCQGGAFSIEAEAALGKQGEVTCVLLPEPQGALQRVPETLVHYVQRTKGRIILNDASAGEEKLSGDDYFKHHRPRSVLCMPILRQAEVVGLLYLENNLLAGAFTPDRLVALELLATQAAISLENALLLAKERTARASAEAAERRSAFLAEAGALLSESLDDEETLARLGRLCVRSLSDWCSIDVVEGRAIRRVVVEHADPEKKALLRELQRRYPPRWGSGHPAATVLRTGRSMLLPELSVEQLRAMCEDEAHLRLLLALGTTSALAVPLVARGQTLGVLTISSGASGRRYGRADLELAEEVARRAAIAIDNARLYRASQEAVRVREEFLSVASHELNTPVTSLTLDLQSMQRAMQAGRSPEPQAMRRMFERALRQGARLTRLNRDLLDVSRIQTARLPLDLVDVDLRALVREVVKKLDHELSHAGSSISIHDGGSVVGRWDRSRIDQILTNLLCNATKFGAGKPIELSFGEEAGIARVTVTDHGIGIDPAMQEKIFERFERAVSKNYGGLGLGLYISRRLAEAHGGTLRVKSAPGAGSTFIVELPCAGPPTAAGRDAQPGG